MFKLELKKKSFISREQDYALRITAFLAGFERGKFISIRELAERLKITPKFAALISHKLKNANIIGTIQGKYGGVYLKADPKGISIWDIIDIIGPKMRLNDCMHDNFICELEFGCKFHVFFYQQEKILFDNLKNHKITDFVFLNI